MDFRQCQRGWKVNRKRAASNLRECLVTLEATYVIRSQNRAQISYSGAMWAWAQAEKDVQDMERYEILTKDAQADLSKTDQRIGHLLAQVEKLIQVLEEGDK